MPSMTEPYPSTLVLSIDEMKEVSRCKQRSKMIRWFRENGFTFKVGLDGYPVISRQHFEKVMGGAAGGRQRTEPKLNWANKV